MLESAGDKMSDSLDAQLESAAPSSENIYPVVAIALVGLSVSAVTYQLWSHYSTEGPGGRNRDLYLMPGILLLLGSGGGLGYLFFSSIYNQVGSASETLSVMMKLPPVVFGIVFLAAAIPGIELYLHPEHSLYM